MMGDDGKVGAIAALLGPLLEQNRSSVVHLGGLGLSHYLGTGTHVIRITCKERWATDLEVETVLLALSRVAGSLPAPGWHRTVDKETLEHVTLITWPVAVQPELF